MPGMAQAKLDRRGIKARPCRPAAAHDAVHQESRARHVPEILQEQDEQEQDHDLGQEDDDAADAGNHTVLQEAQQEAGRQPCSHEGAEGLEATRDRVHQRLRAGEDRLEHNEEHAQEDGEAGDRVKQNGIQPGRQRVGLGCGGDRRGEDAVSLALQGTQFGCGRRRPVGHHGGPMARRERLQSYQKLCDALLAYCHRGNDRHVEFGGQTRLVDDDAPPLRDIAHVEHKQHRPADALEFEHEADSDPQVRGVDDASENVRKRGGVAPSEDNVTRHHLVRAAPAQRVGARKIKQLQPRPGWQDEGPAFPLDRDAGIIGDFLTAAGQPVEQRRLATIGRTDKCDAGCHRVGSNGDRVHSGLTRIANAS